VVDNGDAGFSVTGTWAASTAVSGYLGVNYQHHYANGELPTAIVADNTSGTPSGTWPTSTSVAGYYGTNYQHHAAGTGTESFSWTLNVATAGSYEVYARCDLPRFFDPIVTSENGFRFREGAHEEEPFQRRTDGCDPAGGRQSASSRGRPKAQGQRADHLRLEAAFREVGTCRRETPATA